MTWWLWTFVLHGVLALVVLTVVLRVRREPTAMMSWVLAILFLPFIGSLGYLTLGRDRIEHAAAQRRRRALKSHGLETVSACDSQQQTRSHVSDPAFRVVEQIGRKLLNVPAMAGHEVTTFHDAQHSYAALEEAIHSAQHHVHLEYYTWRTDQTGRRFFNAVIDAARRGVECRVLLDSFGSLGLGRWKRTLREAGVQLGFFLPVLAWGRPHLRNHRKIAVFDGLTALMGSQNIGDEFAGLHPRLSPWHDCQVRLRGPVVSCLQQVFADDWLIATGQPLRGDAYFPKPTTTGHAVIQLIATGPDQVDETPQRVLLAALAAAQSTIRIVTPYFIPSAALTMGLIQAVDRGVSVSVVIPRRTDVRLVLWAGRSFYPQLLRGGVEIREYHRGMLHAKIVTVDDRWCMIGSINMDQRSFRLNFEVAAMGYDRDWVGHLRKTVEGYGQASRRIALSPYTHRAWRLQIIEGVARLASPFL